ncbi:MAG TPA: hypothetical protein VGN72_13420 [Tepidisphaeraceae bacterium]|nr:hypothetical protein [Tepidisphaeraceae bacterium]
MLRWMGLVILSVTVIASAQPTMTLEDDPTARYSSRVMPNLTADEKVVWIDGASPDDATALFPDDRVVTVQQPITGIGWESPDAVIFGPARATDAGGLIGPLLANGTRVVLQADAKPTGPWAWERSPMGWTTQYTVAGPSRFLSPTAYDAIEVRPTGRPVELRRRLVLLVGLFALAALAASLLRRWAMWGVIGASALATVGLVLWGNANATVVRQRVTVVVTTGDVQQVDRWTVDRAPADMRLTSDPDTVGWPVLRSVEHERAAELGLGRASLAYYVGPEIPMLLLYRDVQAATGVPAALQAVSPRWRRLAWLYVGPGTSIVGMETGNETSKSPTIWLRRDEGASK